MIVTRTPFRVTLGGGGTDLPSYYSRYGGFIVSAAINRYVYVMLNRRFEDSIRVSYSQTEIVKGPDAVEHPIVREALKFTELGNNLEIVSIADLPANTGLGSSCAFTVGLLNALHTMKREHVSLEVTLPDRSFLACQCWSISQPKRFRSPRVSAPFISQPMSLIMCSA